MGIKRVVDTAFWTDGKVDEFSPEDKFFMLYLLTNPFTTQLGIYEMSIKQAAFQLGYSVETVKVLLDRFENEYNMIIFSPKTNEIAVLNFLRHSIIKGGKPVEDCLKKELAKVKNKKLVFKVFEHLGSYDGLNDTVVKVIADFRNENENENDNANENDNDNDNDVSYPVSYHDTPTNRARIVSNTKKACGKFNNVLLTDEEYFNFQAAHSDWQERIDKMSAYIQANNKQYKDHYATLELWAMKDKEKQKDTAQPKSNNPFANALKGVI